MTQITILGSGTSSGVPTIGCTCPTCVSTDLRDKRLRPSIWIRNRETTIVIDTSSDFRQQCLNSRIQRLDAVIYTHHHFDHIAGFDDLRAFNYHTRGPVPIYLMRETLTELSSVFRYAFSDIGTNESAIPLVQTNIVDTAPFDVGSFTFIPLPLMHGRMRVNGYRIGNFAYCTDCNFISDMALERMENLDVLVLDALRLSRHPTHFSLEQAIEAAQKIGARQTYFTHIAHDIKHKDVESTLPESLRLAYDGLEIEMND